MPHPSPLLMFVGGMKVEVLAQLLGTTVEELVAAVLEGPRVDAHAGTASAPARARALQPKTSGEPPLAAMFGRATYREIRIAVDRWLLTRVFEEEEGGNVSRFAGRLRISRRALRERWVRILSFPMDEWFATGNRPPAATPSVPAPPSLADMLTRGGGYADIRDAVDRWLIGGVLAREQGNVLQAARSLAMPRTQLRKRWVRVRPQ